MFSIRFAGVTAMLMTRSDSRIRRISDGKALTGHPMINGIRLDLVYPPT